MIHTPSGVAFRCIMLMYAQISSAIKLLKKSGMHKSGVTLWIKVKIVHSINETTIRHELYGLTFYDADIDKLNIPIDRNGDRFFTPFH